jgi:hypothetical protein
VKELYKRRKEINIERWGVWQTNGKERRQEMITSPVREGKAKQHQ